MGDRGMDALEGLRALCARIPESSPLAAAQWPPLAGAAGGQTGSTRTSCMVGGQSSSQGGVLGARALVGITWRQQFSLLHQKTVIRTERVP